MNTVENWLPRHRTFVYNGTALLVTVGLVIGWKAIPIHQRRLAAREDSHDANGHKGTRREEPSLEFDNGEDVHHRFRSTIGTGACRSRHLSEGAWIATGRPERDGSRFPLEAGRDERNRPREASIRPHAPPGHGQKSIGPSANGAGRTFLSHRRPAGNGGYFRDGGSGRGVAFLSGDACR